MKSGTLLSSVEHRAACLTDTWISSTPDDFKSMLASSGLQDLRGDRRDTFIPHDVVRSPAYRRFGALLTETVMLRCQKQTSEKSHLAIRNQLDHTLIFLVI